MTTQRTFEPHEFAPYAEADNICRHCDRGKYALHHEQPRPKQANGTTITEQSQLFSRYTFTVVTGRYKIVDNRSDSEPRVRQIATADGEDEARMIVEALNATEHDDAPAAPERGERWQRKNNEVFIHRDMTETELIAARAKGFKTSDIRYTVARFYGEDAEENAQRAIDAVEQHSTLVAQRERLRQALAGLSRRHPYCWCGTWLGGEHEAECLAAQEAMKLTASEQSGLW